MKPQTRHLFTTNILRTPPTPSSTLLLLPSTPCPRASFIRSTRLSVFNGFSGTSHFGLLRRPEASKSLCHSTRRYSAQQYSSTSPHSRPRSPLLENPESHLPARVQLENTFLTYTSALAAAVLAGFLVTVTFLKQEDEKEDRQFEHPQTETDMATLLPGRPGNLTEEQNEKLRQLWHSFLQLCSVGDETDNEAPADALADKGRTETAATAGSDAPKKKRFGMFRKKNPESKDSKDSKKTSTHKDKAGSPTEDDKYGQTKQFHETLASQSPESIRETVWAMVKHDHPDALLLRFLRARKWDVEKALVMMVSTLNWRKTDMHVDDDIMLKGELDSAMNEKNSEGEAKKMGEDFMAQIRMGKSFLHGTDKQGRPICVVRTRLHKQGEQCEESLERYTVYIIETARMVLSPPVDTATIVFDMTGFTMANMDYTPVKFMIKCFEANYPESLGAVLVHNAPWLFQGIWKIIRGWLDPVVAGKVHFTNNKHDLEEFIEPSRILKELGGDEDWEYKYIEPVPSENDTMKDTESKSKITSARDGLVQEFESATLKWMQLAEAGNAEDAQKVKAKRDEIAAKMGENYWALDPYVRARSVYDRQGALQAGGKLDWYHPAQNAPAETKGASNGAAAAETSADDVD